MQTSLMDLGLAAQDNMLSTMETSKTYMLESVKAWTATTKKMMPDMSGMPGMGKLREMTSGSMGAVSTSYDFAEKVLASQRSFVEELMEVVAPSPA